MSNNNDTACDMIIMVLQSCTSFVLMPTQPTRQARFKDRPHRRGRDYQPTKLATATTASVSAQKVKQNKQVGRYQPTARGVVARRTFKSGKISLIYILCTLLFPLPVHLRNIIPYPSANHLPIMYTTLQLHKEELKTSTRCTLSTFL